MAEDDRTERLAAGDGAEPDTTRIGTGAPDTTRIGTGAPDTTRIGTGAPDTARIGAGVPDTAQIAQQKPGAGEAETTRIEPQDGAGTPAEPVTEALAADSGPGTAQNALPAPDAETYAFGVMPGQTDVFAAPPRPEVPATGPSLIKSGDSAPAAVPDATVAGIPADAAAPDVTPKVGGHAEPAPRVQAYSQAIPASPQPAEPTTIGALPPFTAAPDQQYGVVPDQQYGVVPGAPGAAYDQYGATGLHPAADPAAGYPSPGYPPVGYPPASGGQPAMGSGPSIYDTGYVSSVYPNPLGPQPPHRGRLILPAVLGVLVLIAAGLVGYLLLNRGGDEKTVAAADTPTPLTTAPPTTAAPTTTTDPGVETDHQVRAAKVGDCAQVLIGSQTTFTLVPCTDSRANFEVVGVVDSSSQCTTKWLRNSNPQLTPKDVVLCIRER